MKNNYCLATVCTRKYLSGTIVLINSFIRHNKWFKGDIIVIVQNDDKYIIKKLKKFQIVKIVRVSDRLKNKIDELTVKIKYLKEIYPRLFKLEIFNLTNYSRVVYLDSDMICKGDISDLFFNSQKYLCCKDVTYYLNEIRLFPSFERIPEEGTNSNTEKLGNTHNSGMLSISEDYVNKKVFEKIFSFLREDIFIPVKDMIVDEVVLNLNFNSNFFFIDARYNYRMYLSKAIFKKENFKFKDALIIHYTGEIKPWNSIGSMKKIVKYPGYFKYFCYWQAERFMLIKYWN